ncbi:MAG TPA: ImmA/IrrE family metallo-endopeptidase [Terriglobales bacterium]|nr:ImmA/IrrE family metallo-endopeptidase [Terriglobales bacterium]
MAAGRAACVVGIVLALELVVATGAGAQQSLVAPAETETLGPSTPEASRIPLRQSEELFRSVDEVLGLVSQRTRLPIEHRVGRELADRAEAQRHLKLRLEENGQRFRRKQVVLKRLGLLPRDFDLERFLVEAAGEDLAGFYDARRRTVFLLDWVRPAAQRPVLAHELTHALQDQAVGLEEWLRAREGDDAQAEVEAQEQAAARAALIEAQAMRVAAEYAVASAQVWNAASAASRRAVEYSPEFTAIFHDRPRRAALRQAPLYVRELLSFPSEYGLRFLAELQFHGGGELAFARALAEPPRSTFEIMEPRRYLAGERFEPLRVPDIDRALGPAWQDFDVGAMGALEVHAFLKQFAGDRLAGKMWKRWRGGFYYTAAPSGSGEAAPESLGLAYLSRWEREEDAERFAAAYSTAVRKRYKRATGAGMNRWDTEEGPVSIEVAEKSVLVLEGFDENTAGRLREAFFPELHLSAEK